MGIPEIVDCCIRTVDTNSLPSLFFNVYFYGPEIYGLHRDRQLVATGSDPNPFIQSIKSMLAATRVAHRIRPEKERCEAGAAEANYYLLSSTTLDTVRRSLKECVLAAKKAEEAGRAGKGGKDGRATPKASRPVIQLPLSRDFASMVETVRMRGITRTTIVNWLFDYVYNAKDELHGLAFILDSISFAQFTRALQIYGYDVSEMSLQALLSSISIARMIRTSPLPQNLVRSPSYAPQERPRRVNQIPSYEIPEVLQSFCLSPNADYVYDPLEVNDITEIAAGCSDCSDAA